MSEHSSALIEIVKNTPLTELSVPELAAGLGKSKASIYRKFGSDPIRRAGFIIFESETAPIKDETAEAITKAQSARGILASIVNRCIDVAGKYPGVGPRAALEAYKQRDDQQQFRRVLPVLHDAFTDTVEYGLGRSEIVTANPFRLTRHLLSLTMGVVSNVNGHEDVAGYDGIADVIARAGTLATMSVK
jgi:hypothetical protein